MLLPDQLTTDRLILRPHTEEDLDGFLRVIRDDEATRFVNMPEEEKTEEGLSDFFREVLSSHDSDNPVFGLAIVEKGTRKYVGFCGLSEMPDGTGTETYYVLHPETWGLGYATEAARRLFEYAFSILKLPALDTFLVEENPASHRVAEKLGMRDVGLTDHHEYDKPVKRFRVRKDEFYS